MSGCRSGGMADALDSKSSGGDLVPVQVRPAALLAGASSVDFWFTGDFFMHILM